MLKIYSLLIGENPKYTATFQPSSKRKIALYANCLLIPVILWFINGYLLVNHVLHGSVFSALLTGTLAAIIIFIIERSILMTTSSKKIFWFRIVLGFTMAILGSIALDEVVFKNDIDNQMNLYKDSYISDAEQRIVVKYSQQVSSQDSIVRKKSNEWGILATSAMGESDGTSGSGQAKVGQIARFKQTFANKKQKDYEAENEKLASLLSKIEMEREEAGTLAEQNFNTNGLLLRIKAMFELISTNRYMMVIYLLFTFFLFLLEFLVVIIKSTSKDSIDEELENARVELLRNKYQKTIRTSEMYNRENLYPSVMKSNSLIASNKQSIF
jgi:hypothetical protein